MCRERVDHLEVHIGVEDFGVVLHGWWDQGILVRHSYVQLEHSPLVRSAVRALHTVIQLSHHLLQLVLPKGTLGNYKSMEIRHSSKNWLQY